jgi:hypothetical protein
MNGAPGEFNGGTIFCEMMAPMAKANRKSVGIWAAFAISMTLYLIWKFVISN